MGLLTHFLFVPQVRFFVSAKLKQLQALLEPGVNALGFELWGIEYVSQGRNSTLRIYIDSENGIDVDDCAKVSHQVSGVLDVEDPITGHYTLEVSSPGMDRPLFTLEQFAAYAGSQVQVRLRIAFEGRRKFKGLLNGVEGDDVLVVVDNEEYLLPIEYIDKANVIPQF
jgi:ribosome maturation factor RimP